MKPVKDGFKRCPRCGKEKQINKFGKRITSKDGHNIYCMSCVRKMKLTHNINSKLDAAYPHKSKKVATRYKIINEIIDETIQDEIELFVANYTQKIINDKIRIKCAWCGEYFYMPQMFHDYLYEECGQSNFWCSKACYEEHLYSKHDSKLDEEILSIELEYSQKL